jgi:TonB family protein
MLLLSNLLLVIVALSAVPDQRDVSLRVQRAVEPVRPVHTLATGLVVVEIEIDRMTGALQTRVLHGDSPFVPPALDTLKHWRFSAPPGAVRSRTSITFLFRPPLFRSLNVPAGVIRPWMPGDDSAALPQKVVDPGYPPDSNAAGAVILEVMIDAAGSVTGIDVVRGVADLTEQTKTAVKNWKFSPAIVGGRPMPSAAVVVITFMAPL